MNNTCQQKSFRTVIIGFGKVGAGYVDDPVMARHYPVATHAQALTAHPGFAWDAVVDVSETALESARQRWGIQHTAHCLPELAQTYAPEVAVLATPPDTRLELLEQLPNLRAVLVEKPLGETLAQGEAFLTECARRGIVVQVNLWRRADTQFQRLAAGELENHVGDAQAVFALYGNGLRNNGTHLIDFARMLFGEVAAAQIAPGFRPYPAGPLAGDLNVPFSLQMESGLCVMAQPVDFAHYRENSFDIWGTRGRLTIQQEGLGIHVYPRCNHRATQHEHEIASDCPRALQSTVGHAFYRMFDNLADALVQGSPLCSPGPSALRATALVENLMEQASARIKDEG